MMAIVIIMKIVLIKFMVMIYSSCSGVEVGLLFCNWKKESIKNGVKG